MDENTDPGGEAISFGDTTGVYKAGKWGRYVRAPDFYFEVMRQFGAKFAALGEISEVRFGVKTGCDAFFMPHDVTRQALVECETASMFRKRFGVDRHLVAAGEITIIKAGDRSVHPIESKFLAPEVHSLMEIDRPVLRASSLDRLVLLVGQPFSDLQDTLVSRYLRYGQTNTFSSTKSRPVPVPQRSTCAARDPWYDLTHLVKPGFAFWPKSQQYRHIIPANPERIICNCNLYDIAARNLSEIEKTSLLAVLNSTLVALFKTFYGRFAGTEGNLKTEVVDVKMLEVPDPRGVPHAIANRLLRAFHKITDREAGRLVEEALMDCHSSERAHMLAALPILLPEELCQPDRRELDDAVFELLGVANPTRRQSLIDRLYNETALHFRHIRVVEIQKMEQRSSSRPRRISASELAGEAWEAFEQESHRPLREWLEKQPATKIAVTIPPVSPATLEDESHMFDSQTVYFGRNRETHLVCHSRQQAEIVTLLSNIGIDGVVDLPADEKDSHQLLTILQSKLAEARRRFEKTADSRTSNERLHKDIVNLMMQWFIHGRSSSGIS
jgi:hypothetical protein